MSNNRLHLSKPLVTPLAGARAAPTGFAGEASRYGEEESEARNRRSAKRRRCAIRPEVLSGARNGGQVDPVAMAVSLKAGGHEAQKLCPSRVPSSAKRSFPGRDHRADAQTWSRRVLEPKVRLAKTREALEVASITIACT